MQEVLVGLGSCGIAAGGREVHQRFSDLLSHDRTETVLKRTGCLGLCHCEVLVEVRDGRGAATLYGGVTPERVDRIFRDHVRDGRPIPEWSVDPGEVLGRQTRIVLRSCGVIDPWSLDEYLNRGGYRALTLALSAMTPANVIDVIAESGLRGRGGAGFPTGTKWRLAASSADRRKYIICNADEGDPGAFMDRSVLEGDPHSVLEGMAIAAYAIGAERGYIYVRAEYPEAVRTLRHAIEQSRARGFLSNGSADGPFRFDVSIKEGAGAFVCGEETALIASIEGRRGMPAVRPPYPTEAGLWGHPTCINNVETLANVPWILLHGAQAYRELGTAGSRGTKVFALAGKVRRGGLVEVPMGMTINEVVYDIGGGCVAGGPFKAVQMGGPSGGCIPSFLGDTPIDYEQITATGAIMGSGGLVVMDQSTCMVDIARFFLSFTQNESCGKCTFCRIGTKRMLEILDRICSGLGMEGDVARLAELGEQIKSNSLCGLGQTAPNPVLTTLRYFPDEFEAHIRDKRCPALACLALVEFRIREESCSGCGLCLAACGAGAIRGERKEPHVIDPSLCTRCGKCATVCAPGAIEKR